MTDDERERLARGLETLKHHAPWATIGLDQAAAQLRADGARIKALEAERQWQPIETAPKDGTAVLVWRTHEPGRELLRMGIDRWLGGCWWNSRRDMQPTHWMRLPAPPAEDD